MNSRERFIETMRYGKPDRVPCFEEGIRDEVIKVWRRQGLPKGVDLARMFHYDRREEIEPDLEPRPEPEIWPASMADLEAFRRRLDPDDPGRLPEGWSGSVRLWQARDYPLILWAHRGFFLSMGVDGWERFTQVVRLLIRNPQFVGEALRIQGEFAASLAQRVLQDVRVDAVMCVEPIAENRGPLISPKMYRDFVLRSYEPLLQVLRRYEVETIIFMTFANTRLLLPDVLKWGFNCLWACEVNMRAMDYRDLRREFGRDLRLIGGIDMDALRQDKDAIRREILEKVPQLLEEGGYVPLADGRIRADVPFENYAYYRQLLEDVVTRRRE